MRGSDDVLSRNAPAARSTPAACASSNGNGSGSVTAYRLGELERRIGTIEDKVDDLSAACARIDTKIDGSAETTDTRIHALAERSDARIDGLAERFDAKIDGLAERFDAKIDGLAERIDARIDGLATKSHVAWIFGGTLVLAVVSFAVHAMIRYLGG